MDAEELIEKARDQRRRGRYEEAVISAEAASMMNPDNADGWWCLALNNISLDRKESALKALKKTNETAPHFAAGWAKRGGLELELGDTEDAELFFEIAIEHDENEINALQGLANIYQDKDSSEKRTEEIRVLTKLDDLEGLNSRQINRLGILHFHNKHGYDAIKYWSRNAYQNDNAASLFNLGLAYNMGDISQDVDAIDCWRLTLRRNPFSDTASESIRPVKARLLELASKVRSSRVSLCLPEDQWYSIYINPFQLLNCPEDFDFDDLEPKIAQKWKKTLLQEIELEEGKLHWMPGLTIDRSKAIEIADKISNMEDASYNWKVYKCTPLMEFLSKGDISHFLLDEEWSPLDFIEFVSVSEDLGDWLSEPFSTQYDCIFSKAVAAREVLVIEALLDGRRWVMPSYADRCFEGALREADSILHPLRELKVRAGTNKVDANDIKKVLHKHKITSILNLLPPYFYKLQNEAVTLVRSIAIDAHNIHEDSELSLAIIEQSKEFSVKSIELTQKLKEDFETISEIIKEQNKYESHLNFGNARKWRITKQGIFDNGELCPVNEIRSLRWGIRIEENGSHNYLFAVKRKTGKEHLVTWTSSNRVKQGELFQEIVNAALHYVIPSLIERFLLELNLGETLKVGPVQITRHGISFESKGLFFSRMNQVSWSKVDVVHHNGTAIVKDKFSGKQSLPISLRDVPNAIILGILIMSFNRK